MFGVWIECINRIRPTLIEAYADALFELSRWVVEEKVPLRSPRAIITSAGVLAPHMRETIREAFGCPVLDRYGSREVGAIACSCISSNELHVQENACYVEVVDEEGRPCAEGVEGDILVTLLTNYAMPLIRYKIQDRGEWALGPCPCGRKTKRLARISGRQSDYLLALDGTRINGTALTTLLYSVSNIVRYQYRQDARGRVVLTVVPKDAGGVDHLKTEMCLPMERLKSMLGGMPVELAIVNDISPSKSGKYRYVVRESADTELGAQV